VATRAFSTCDVLGLAPHRQMTAGRLGQAETMARIDRALIRLRRAGRRAILIVDNKCGDGGLLIRAARRAGALGFVAVEALGFDRSPERIAAARRAAVDNVDPRIRLGFALRHDTAPLELEDDADLMLADPDEEPPSVLAELTHPTGTIIHR
jgi:SAM-dependent methyltransferase